jgi:mRNA-degrading endonuclease RelE of RelBE toxin-antitoxin system
MSNQKSCSNSEYNVNLHNAVRRFLRRHSDLNQKWDGIVDRIKQSPKLGPHIDHLKGDWFCSYRWDEGSYRIKYDVHEEDEVIFVYDANNRGDAYKRRQGSGRRR